MKLGKKNAIYTHSGVKWVRTKDMVADILTKPLDQQTIEHLWKLGGGV